MFMRTASMADPQALLPPGDAGSTSLDRVETRTSTMCPSFSQCRTRRRFLEEAAVRRQVGLGRDLYRARFGLFPPALRDETRRFQQVLEEGEFQKVGGVPNSPPMPLVKPLSMYDAPPSHATTPAAQRLRLSPPSVAGERAPPWSGGGRRFESVRGLCKSPGNRGFSFRLDLQDLQLAQGMEPFMELTGLKDPSIAVGAPATSRRRQVCKPEYRVLAPR